MLSTAICFTSLSDAGIFMANVYADDAVEIVDEYDTLNEIDELDEEVVEEDGVEEMAVPNDVDSISPDAIKANTEASVEVDSSSLVVNNKAFEVKFNVKANTTKEILQDNYITLYNDDVLEAEVVIGDAVKTSTSFNSYPATVKGRVSENGILTFGYKLKNLDVSKSASTELYKASVSIIIDSTDLNAEDFPANTVENDLGLVVTFGGKDMAKGIVKSQGNYYYTGKAIKPEIKIFDGNIELVNGKDYKLKYKNNKNAVSNNELTEKFGTGWVHNGFLDKFNSFARQPQIQITGMGAYKGVKLVKFFNIVPIDYDEDKYIYVKPEIQKTVIKKSPKNQKPTLNVNIYQAGKKKSTLKKGENKDYIIKYTPVSANTTPDGKVEYIKNSVSKDSIPADASGIYMLTIVPTRIGKTKISAEPYDAGVVTIMDPTKNLANAKVEFTKKTYEYDEMGTVIVSENSIYNGGKRFAYWVLSSNMVKVYMNGTEMSTKDYTIVAGDNAGTQKHVYIMLTESGKERYNYVGMEEGKPCKIKTKLKVNGINIAKKAVFSMKTTRGDLAVVSKKINVPYDGSIAKYVDDYANQLIVEYGSKVLSGNGLDYEVKILKSCKLPVGTAKFRVYGTGKYSASYEITVNVEQGAKPVSVNDIVKVCQFGVSSNKYVNVNSDNEATLNPLPYSKTLKPEIKLVTFENKELEDGTVETVYKDLTKKDYKATIQYENKKTKVGKATAKVVFKGIYKNIPSINLEFDILPQTDPNQIWSNGIIVNSNAESMSIELFAKKASSGVKLAELTSGKKLTKKDYVIEEDPIVDVSGNAIRDDEVTPDRIYYIEVEGKGSYEGLTKLIPVTFGQKASGIKVKTNEAIIGYKGDVSYLDNKDFIESIGDDDISAKDVEILPASGKGNYDTSAQKWDFDPEYYGKPGNKSILLYVTSGDYAGKYISAKIKVVNKEKEVSTYKYIRSFLGL